MQEGDLFALLEGTADAAFTVDGQGRIRSWNASAEKLFGYTCAEVLNRSCRALLEGRHGPACQGCRGANFDLEVLTQAGRRLWVNVSTLVDDGLIVHLARDISERKKNEEFGRQVLSLSRNVASPPARGAQAAPLSDQEQRILRGFAGGGNSAEIARDLGISLQTLRNHLHRINQKLGTHTRLEAVMQAIQRGWV